MPQLFAAVLGVMLPSAIENILLDFSAMAMKGSSSSSYSPHADIVGWPQYTVQPASAIVVGIVPFSTDYHISSPFSSSSPFAL